MLGITGNAAWGRCEGERWSNDWAGSAWFAEIAVCEWLGVVDER